MSGLRLDSPSIQAATQPVNTSRFDTTRSNNNNVQTSRGNAPFSFIPEATGQKTFRGADASPEESKSKQYTFKSDEIKPATTNPAYTFRGNEPLQTKPNSGLIHRASEILQPSGLTHRNMENNTEKPSASTGLTHRQMEPSSSTPTTNTGLTHRSMESSNSNTGLTQRTMETNKSSTGTGLTYRAMEPSYKAPEPVQQPTFNSFSYRAMEPKLET